jgi:4,5-dihydroxyphthalate decarboxylase
MIGLATLLGDYPVTRALKGGEVRSSSTRLDFADVREPTSAFPRVVSQMEFDVAELPIITFLIAKAHGVPLTLLPSVIFARFPHSYLVYNPERGPLAPEDLEGRRIGIRSYSVTTVTYIRDILANDYGVDCDKVRWISTEKPHVESYVEPDNVSLAPKGKSLVSMLADGEVDAAVLGAKMGDARLSPLMSDPDRLTALWRARSHGALPINHMVAVRSSLCRDNPEAVRETYRMLRESKAGAATQGSDLNFTPFGVDPCRRSLEFAIDMAFRQNLISRRFEVDELFDDLTRTF